jgi:uncharacterized membrane protein
MANLLPENKKKELSQQYVLKLAAVAFVFVFATVLLAIVGLLPSYFATTIKAKTIEEDLKHAENKTVVKSTDDDVVSKVKAVNTLAPTLEAWFGTPFAYEAIIDAVAERVGDVGVTSVVYSRERGNLVISGAAKKRDDLIAFKNSLQKYAQFKTIDLPVSDLAHKENLLFSITITLVYP